MCASGVCSSSNPTVAGQCLSNAGMICRVGLTDCVSGLTCYASKTGLSTSYGYCAVPNGGSCTSGSGLVASGNLASPCKGYYNGTTLKKVYSICVNNVCAAPKGDSCKSGAGCQSGLCSASECVTVAVAGAMCTSKTACGGSFLCTNGFCQNPSGSDCTSASGCQSGVCSGSGSGSTCVSGTASVGALCSASTTGCNCLSGKCVAFPTSTWAIPVTVTLGVLMLLAIGVAAFFWKKLSEVRSGSAIAYSSA
jgi:hypothetical protein